MIRRGFEQLSSSIAWRVMGLQSSALKQSRAGLKRLMPVLAALLSQKSETFAKNGSGRPRLVMVCSLKCFEMV